MPITSMMTKATPAMQAMTMVSRSSCFWSGVLSVSVLLSMSAMWPISVSMLGRGDDHLPPAAGDRGVHEREAVTVADGHVDPVDGVGVLERRRTLAGEGGLLDLERGGQEEPPVGRHPVARLDQDDVAGNQLFRVDLHGLAVAPYPGRVLEGLLQRGQAGGGLGLADAARGSR